MLVKAKLLVIILFKTLYLHVFFKLNSFNRIISKFSDLKPITNNGDMNHVRATKLMRLILRYIFFSNNCFHRSFISAAVLKIIGVNVKLIIGVSLVNSFKSHAWIEVDERPILENLDLNKYKIIYKS